MFMQNRTSKLHAQPGQSAVMRWSRGKTVPLEGFWAGWLDDLNRVPVRLTAAMRPCGRMDAEAKDGRHLHHLRPHELKAMRPEGKRRRPSCSVNREHGQLSTGASYESADDASQWTN